MACGGRVITKHYWPRRNDPAREGALVWLLRGTENSSGTMVRGYDGRIWWAEWNELEDYAHGSSCDTEF